MLRGAAGVLAVGAAGLPGCGAGGGQVPSGSRVAIVGAGAGGIASAYFLHGTHDVDVFESSSSIGGHCDSRTIEYAGQPVTVDLGAQFFHPATHPLYVTLLEELGVYDPEHPDDDETLEATGSVCIFSAAGGAPAFSSTQPLATLFRAIDFAIYSQAARAAVLENTSWEVTLGEWIAGLPSPADFKDQVLYPWISSLIGTTRENALRTSARSILQTFALAFPENLLDGASTFNSKIGLAGNLQRMLDRSPRARVHLDSAATALVHDGAWFVRTAAGQHGPYEAVVLNASPRVGRELLRPLSWAAPIVALMDQYEYFDSRLVIHTDPVYMHSDRSHWSVYNAGVDELECEGSAWLGALHERLPSGATIDVFKSWAQHRRFDPASILLERRFKHPLITPAAIRAARGLGDWQGHNGLYFGGQYTTGMDLQESALFSAMQVAEALAPASAQLASLRTRLVQRERDGISYAL